MKRLRLHDSKVAAYIGNDTKLCGCRLVAQWMNVCQRTPPHTVPTRRRRRRPCSQSWRAVMQVHFSHAHSLFMSAASTSGRRAIYPSVLTASQGPMYRQLTSYTQPCAVSRPAQPGRVGSGMAVGFRHGAPALNLPCQTSPRSVFTPGTACCRCRGGCTFDSCKDSTHQHTSSRGRCSSSRRGSARGRSSSSSIAQRKGQSPRYHPQ